MNRRGLLSALGLGGVGLVCGQFDLIAAEVPETVDQTSLSMGSFELTDLEDPPSISWVHPDMDKIDAWFTITGGYPRWFGRFPSGPVIAGSGDILKMNYDLTALETITLYRVYDVLCSCTVIGTSIQGPVVQDLDEPLGHRLATFHELRPNNKESLKINPEHALYVA